MELPKPQHEAAADLAKAVAELVELPAGSGLSVVKPKWDQYCRAVGKAHDWPRLAWKAFKADPTEANRKAVSAAVVKVHGYESTKVPAPKSEKKAANGNGNGNAPIGGGSSSS